MQLWIHTYNNEILDNLENILYSDDRLVANWFMKNFPGEIYETLSEQYEIQVIAGMQIRKLLGGNIFKNIKGIYFGSDQCEFLLPSVSEIEKAIKNLKEFDKKFVSKDIKKFVLLTSYYGNNKIREKLIKVFTYLNENASFINTKSKNVEIVVNDFGTLKLLENFSNLKPILGRLLVKTLKNPLVDTFGLEKNLHIAGEMMKNKTSNEIDAIKKEIAINQLKGIGKSALNNKYFIKFLESNDIQRAGLDYLKGFPDLYNIDTQIDLYYPYSLIYVGRLCDTAAIDDIRRGYYPIDSICTRTCLKYDINIQNIDTVGYKIITRGNSGYKTQIELELSQEVVDKYENRLVFSPFI